MELQPALETEAQRIASSMESKQPSQMTGKVTFTQKFETFNVTTVIEFIHEITQNAESQKPDNEN